MEVSHRPPMPALDAAHPFAVSLWEVDGSWPTDHQALALDAAFDAQSIDIDGLERFLACAETAALDVAGIGSVLGVISKGYTNRFRFNGMPTPTVKTDAGCPNGFWLPPAQLLDRAEAVLRQRTDGSLDADGVVDWARVQVGSWWSIAAAFAPGASVRKIDDSALPIVVGGPLPASLGSSHPLGDIWAIDHAPVAKVSRCEATYLYSVPATGPEFYDVVGIDRRCVLPAVSGGHCRFHKATS